MKIFLAIIFCLFYSSALGSLVDENATNETKELYTQLQNAEGNHIYFGISNYGISSQTKQCHYITGKEPYVIAADYLNSVDTGYNFNNSIDAIKKHYRNGGISTFNWHMKNFVTDGNCRDVNGSVVENILPGGNNRTEYLEALDEFAADMLNLTDDKGNLIPIILRLWHENDMNWAWWQYGSGTSIENYKSLWIDFVTYMKYTKGVHNLIYCYSPGFEVNDHVSEDMYPGDEYVDIIAIDQYKNSTTLAMPYYKRGAIFADYHDKVFAIAEGCRDIGTYEMSDYWTTGYSEPLLNQMNVSYTQDELFNHSTQGTFVVTDPAEGEISYSNGTAVLNTLVANSNTWYVRYGKSFDQKYGKIYKISFNISADSIRNITQSFQEADSPYTVYQNSVIHVTTEPIKNMVYFVGEANDSSTLCRFFVGGNTGNVTISEMELTEYSDFPVNPAWTLVWDTRQSDGAYGWGPWDGRSDEDSFLAMSQNPKIRFLQYKQWIYNATLRNATFN